MCFRGPISDDFSPDGGTGKLSGQEFLGSQDFRLPSSRDRTQVNEFPYTFVAKLPEFSILLEHAEVGVVALRADEA